MKRKTQQQLVAEADAWMAEMDRMREWLLRHPSRVDPVVWPAAINWTEVVAAEMLREMFQSTLPHRERLNIRNARQAGRTSRLRTRLKELIAAILTQDSGVVKEEAR